MKIKTLLVMLFFCNIILANGNSIHSDLCYKGGCPTTGRSRNYIVSRSIYVLDINCNTKFADWVAYKVSKENITLSIHSHHKRGWKIDNSVPRECTTSPVDWYGAYGSYTYEKGHMAPLGAFDNSDRWMDTNYLSNIEPQTSNLNEGPWANLERHVRDLSIKYGYVYVITGPIYMGKMPALPNKEDVVVPSDYFKVIITPEDEPHIEVYILPQHIEFKEDYNNYKSTIQVVQKLTGINLFGEDYEPHR